MTRAKPLLHQITYISAARKPFTGIELAALLVKARANNRRLGVSGMLIHREGSFFQILEGEEATVTSLYNRISADPRHIRIVVLARESAPTERTFGDWSMGFVEGSQPSMQGVPGFNDFFRQGFALTELKNGAHRGKALATAFREGRFRQFVDGS
jgi:hypothetical protein